MKTNLFVIFAFSILGLASCNSNKQHLTSKDSQSNTESVELDTMTVQDYEIVLSDSAKYIARYLFSGIVIRDEANGEYIPYKKGRAVVTKGELKGAVYEGDFDGTALNSDHAVIKMTDGSWFEGSFVYNDIVEGTYHFDDGAYCTGYFREFNPLDVEVFDKNGKSEGHSELVIE